MKNIPDKTLKKVAKPARYTGGELNMAVKDPLQADARFCLCFPDVYEVGMSHLGSSILYHLINERTNVYCERAYAPWVDMEEELRKASLPLYSLETGTPLKAFDILGFLTLLRNVLYQCAIHARSFGYPFLCKGKGRAIPADYRGWRLHGINPEPLADFIDLVCDRRGGRSLTWSCLRYLCGIKNKGYQKEAFLKEAAQIQGVYVPAFYTPLYNEDGTMKEIQSISDAPKVVKKRFIKRHGAKLFSVKTHRAFSGYRA